MNQNLLNQIAKWHEDEEHEEIINTIRAIDEHEWTYELIGLLARAENNMDNYEEAERLLLSVKDKGINDHIWCYRLGYSYYYQDKNEEALEMFEKYYAYDKDDEQVLYFMASLYDMLEIEPRVEIPQTAKDEWENTKNSEINLETYTEEEMACVEKHISTHFGEFQNVFHEIVSTDLHIDICVIPPDNDREFYTLVTMGAGACSMNIPEDLADKNLNRMELVICLPIDWDIKSQDEKDYWPIRMLKGLARFPKNQNTWFGWGHSIGNAGETFDKSVDFTGAILFSPMKFSGDAQECELPNGDVVNFYQVVPIYEEEMNYKLENTADELLEKFKEQVPFQDIALLNINRLNACKMKH